MFGLSKRAIEPAEETGEKGWFYLGHTTVKLTRDSKIVDQCSIHFFGRRNFEERKITHAGWSKDKLHDHGFYQDYIVPWLNGENLFRPILMPSEQLQAETEKQKNYKWDATAKKWAKLPPRLADISNEEMPDTRSYLEKITENQ